MSKTILHSAAAEPGARDRAIHQTAAEQASCGPPAFLVRGPRGGIVLRLFCFGQTWFCSSRQGCKFGAPTITFSCIKILLHAEHLNSHSQLCNLHVDQNKNQLTSKRSQQGKSSRRRTLTTPTCTFAYTAFLAVFTKRFLFTRCQHAKQHSLGNLGLIERRQFRLIPIHVKAKHAFENLLRFPPAG